MTTTKSGLFVASVLALVAFAPGCSFVGSLGAAVPIPGGAALTQGMSSGMQSVMNKRAECKTRAAAPAEATIDPETGAPIVTGGGAASLDAGTMGAGTMGAGTVGVGTGTQLASAATGVLSNGMCDRLDRRKAKRQAKREEKRRAKGG